MQWRSDSEAELLEFALCRRGIWEYLPHDGDICWKMEIEVPRSKIVY